MRENMVFVYKTFQTASPLKVYNKLTPKIMYADREGLYQSSSMNCEISNFGFFAIFFCVPY